MIRGFAILEAQLTQFNPKRIKTEAQISKAALKGYRLWQKLGRIGRNACKAQLTDESFGPAPLVHNKAKLALGAQGDPFALQVDLVKEDHIGHWVIGQIGACRAERNRRCCVIGLESAFCDLQCGTERAKCALAVHGQPQGSRNRCAKGLKPRQRCRLGGQITGGKISQIQANKGLICACFALKAKLHSSR